MIKNMTGSKPEELVAKLYEEGMNDDDVRAQLIDFGLSGREIHILIKRAKELVGDQKKGPSEPEAVAKPLEAVPGERKEEKPSGEKKGMFGFLGKKKDAEEKEKRELEPHKTAAQKSDDLISLISSNKAETPAEPKAAEKSEEKKGRFGFLDKKGAGGEEKKPAAPSKEQKPAGAKKGLFGFMGGKKEAAGPQTARSEDMQAKMKRLAIIKDTISNPVTPAKPMATELKTIAEAAPEKAEKAKSQKYEEEYDEEEEKMDNELAKKLIEGIENLESEMGEVRQLLETLRELNIKLIEIMENK